MKEVSLTKGFVALVDDDMYEYLNQWKWHLSGGYAARYDCSNGHKNKVKIFMHRLILCLVNNKTKGDHIDRNKLNNQRSNLMIATWEQNNANRKAKRSGASKYLGVYKNTTTKKGKAYSYWAASIRTNKIITFLGTFKSEDKAAFAYNQAAIKIHGEFANLNNIETANV